mgnify:CR=1 FL=1
MHSFLFEQFFRLFFVGLAALLLLGLLLRWKRPPYRRPIFVSAVATLAALLIANPLVTTPRERIEAFLDALYTNLHSAGPPGALGFMAADGRFLGLPFEAIEGMATRAPAKDLRLSGLTTQELDFTLEPDGAYRVRLRTSGSLLYAEMGGQAQRDAIKDLRMEMLLREGKNGLMMHMVDLIKAEFFASGDMTSFIQRSTGR